MARMSDQQGALHVTVDILSTSEHRFDSLPLHVTASPSCRWHGVELSTEDSEESAQQEADKAEG